MNLERPHGPEDRFNDHHHHHHKVPGFVLGPLKFMGFFSVFVFPLIQFFSWISAFVIMCKNKGKFHFFHSMHGLTRLIMLSIQLVWILLILVIDLVVRKFYHERIIHRKMPFVGLLIGGAFIVFSATRYLKRGLKAKWKRQ
jgi:hypothetical protein